MSSVSLPGKVRARCTADMRRRGRLAVAFAAGLAAVAVSATPAGAAGGSVEGPEPVPAPPFLLPAGEVCDFPLAGTFPVNEQQAYVLRDADGSVRAEYVTGRLVGRFTNTATGETVERDLSGSGVVTYRSDGSQRFTAVGAAAIGFHTGDRPANIFEVNGARSVVVVDFAADGRRTRLVQGGPYEDLCATLS